MLNAIVSTSLRFRGIVMTLACLLVGYGLYAVARTKYDVFPEFAPPQVTIQTEAPGLAPEQVEVLVTQPLENAINGVAGIESLRSDSIQGLSILVVKFHPGSDIYQDRQVVAERLASVAGQFPEGIREPVMTSLTSSTSMVLVLGLTAEQRSLMDLRTIADWVVKQRLLAVPGVAKVAVFGGEVKQLQVQIRPRQLIHYNLALEDVVAVVHRATGVRGAGFIENDNQRIVLQTEGQSLTVEQLAQSVLVHHDGVAIPLAEVATVAEAPEPPIGAATVMGRPGVSILVSAQYGANTRDVTARVEQALSELRPALHHEGVTLHADLFRPANFIDAALHNIQSSLLIGAVLVVMVLCLFLLNVRTAVISCTAIPLSLLAAVTVLDALGVSLNTMTLGGLAIALGEVVDDAVIDVENILRRLRANRALAQPRPLVPVIVEASLEVRGAVVYATFAVVLVFLPILTMSGVAGRLFAPLAMTYILAVLASLLVALTVTPALCLLLLGPSRLQQDESRVVCWLKNRYQSLLGHIEQHARVVIAGVTLVTLAGIAILPTLGGEFLPELREGHFIIHMSALPGTSLSESLRLGQRVTSALVGLPSVRTVAQRVGRAEAADDVWGPHYSEFEVDLHPLDGAQAEVAQAEIRRTLAQFPGVHFAVKTFLTERIEETLSGYTASVVIAVYGNDLAVIDHQAQEVATVLRTVPGATDVQVQSPPGTPQFVIRLRKAALLRWGFAAVDVLEAVRTAYQGYTVGQVYEENRVVNLAVILEPHARQTIMDVGELPLRNAAGTYVLLRQLADIEETAGRSAIVHHGARRVQVVTCNVMGSDLRSFVAAAQTHIRSRVAFPPGVSAAFGGAAEAQAQSQRDLLVHSAVAGIGIVLLLSIVLGSARNLALVLVNLPFALVGGVLAVLASGGALSIGSMVGFVTLFGITLRNAIMMIAHYEHLVTVEEVPWGPEAAIRGATERLSPILMTAFVTALGLLPLALGSGEPGREIEGPLAIVILGGLVTSTVLNLLVLPTLALRYGRFARAEEST